MITIVHSTATGLVIRHGYRVTDVSAMEKVGFSAALIWRNLIVSLN
jgi:hypothetical protein